MNPTFAKFLLNSWQYIVKIIAAILLILAPIKAALILIIVLTILDLILGVWAAVKHKHSITSKSLRRTISKILVYEVTVIVAFLIETYLIPDFPFSKIVLALVGLTEGKSLFENLYRITKIDYVKKLIDIIQLEHDKQMPNSTKPNQENGSDEKN